MGEQTYIDGYIQRARAAQAAFEGWDQAGVDRAVQAVARVVFEHAEPLAQMAVEETGMGNVPDKIAKNQGKARIIWNSLKGKKSMGIIERDEATGIVKVAKPIGVVAAITPCTNPIVTPMSNAMFALKGRNAIIITPHHKAIASSTETVRLISEALAELGAPEDLVQILGEQSRENTKELIGKADVVIATGGAGMVNAAYSSGRPALGVGAGNVQAIIDRDADFADAAAKITAGRAFDYGIICSGEQSVMVPAEKKAEIIAEFVKCGAFYVESAAEREALRQAMFVDGAMNRHAVGQSPQAVGKLAGLAVPEDAKIILVEAEGCGRADILAKEKMCPVLSLYVYEDFKEAVEIARANLEVEGKGHSVVVHSNNKGNIEYAGTELCVSRIVVNQVCASSAGGSFYNGLSPTNTLGCGSWGHNSISENLTYKHLINVSQIAYFMPDNRVPTDAELWEG